MEAFAVVKSPGPTALPGIPAAHILGVRVHCVDASSLMEIVSQWSGESIRRTIVYAHSKTLNDAYQDDAFRKLLNAADLTYSDGISAVWAGKLLTGLSFCKVTGAEWINDFARMAASHRVRAYFLGSRPGIARQAADVLVEKYPGLMIVGTSDGYFQEKNQSEVLKEIATCHPQVVFVGMGSPLQEEWIATNREAIQAPVCWAVGALFDFVAGKERRVPAWMNSLGLEWLWRFLVDPRGKWRRTLIGNPLFVLRVLRQKYSREVE